MAANPCSLLSVEAFRWSAWVLGSLSSCFGGPLAQPYFADYPEGQKSTRYPRRGREPLPALVGAYLASRRQRFDEWRELGSQALLVAPPRPTTPLVTRRAGGA